MLGKEKRLNRLFNQSHNIIFTPLDHGITVGPIKGIENINDTIVKLRDSGVDSLIMHKGILRNNYKELNAKNLGVVMHLSASTDVGNLGNSKVSVATVDEAIAYGCDGVSIHVNIGNEYESDMLKEFGRISRECYAKGMPLIAMMYARGDKIKCEKDVKYVKHIARIAEELGADIVKVNYTGDIESFNQVVSGCSIPIVIAGGEKMNESQFLNMVSDAMKAGARGVSVGRNIFQSSNMCELIGCCRSIVHEGKTLQELNL